MSPPRKHQKRKRPASQASAAQVVFRQIPVIELLAKKSTDAKLRKQLLDLSPSSVRALSSIAKNALEGSLPLKSRKQRLVIEKYRPMLMNLAKGGTSLQKKKLVLQQSGGFFPALAGLLPAAISVVSSLIGGGS